MDDRILERGHSARNLFSPTQKAAVIKIVKNCLANVNKRKIINSRETWAESTRVLSARCKKSFSQRSMGNYQAEQNVFRFFSLLWSFFNEQPGGDFFTLALVICIPREADYIKSEKTKVQSQHGAQRASAIIKQFTVCFSFLLWESLRFLAAILKKSPNNTLIPIYRFLFSARSLNWNLRFSGRVGQECKDKVLCWFINNKEHD